MPANQTEPSVTDDPIASCALDPTARNQQEARYRSLANAVGRVDRTAELLTVRFDERLDHDLLEQALAVERECCPFFVFQFDGRDRRLTISVREADQTPALEVLATAFTKAHRARVCEEPADVRER